MPFVKYQHIERFGTEEVEGIEVGECYVFPKIDGTCSVLFYEDGRIHAGSRNRELSSESDNAGFYKALSDDDRILEFYDVHKDLILYGEFLVPHSLKTYKDAAWRKFYVFDVCRIVDDKLHYLPYTEYQPILEEFSIDYIPPLRIINNPDYDKLVSLLDQNTFLIKDGEGAGEGIVIKRYDFVNKYGRTTWAKIVTSEFKEKHAKVMGASRQEGKDLVEEKICEKFVTQAMVDKVHANIVNEKGWSSKDIPRLLDTVFHDLIKEESWNFLKEFKFPSVNYRTLRSFCYSKVKTLKQELF
jgi:hypothetical protein